jgi:catechol 2,3-dioxygenase-like lactoylglutathione lyase family enzyme
MANTFHVAISVKNLESAVAHYTKMFGIAPAKVKPDYAKFELADPPAIISLNLGGEPGTVSHVGIRYGETEAGTSALARTKSEGIPVREQVGTTCCYAKADKFWVYDTDGLEWEMYTLLEDAEVHSIVETPKDVCCSPTVAEESNAQPQAASRCCAPAMTVPAEASLVQIQAKSACCS